MQAVALAIMGEWPTETSLYHQVMRKLVSHDTDTHGPFRPFIDDANASRRHFEILTSMPVTTAEGEQRVHGTSNPCTKKAVLNFPDLQIRILRQDERGVSQILKDNPSSVSEVNCYGQNSVHIAVGVGNLKVLQMILRYADALSLNAQDYAKGRGRYAVEYAAISQFHIGYRDTDNVECNCCDILDALLQADCALYPSFFLSIFFGCTRSEEGGTADCALRKVMLCLKERRQRLGEYAKKHLAPTQAVAFGIYGTSVLDEAAGDVQTALEERSISIPTSLRPAADATGWDNSLGETVVQAAVTIADVIWFCDFWAIAEESQPWANSSKPTPVLKLILRYLTFTALGLRHSCCRLAQSEGIQYWDSEEVDEVLEEQKEDILRLEELLEELKQDYEESPDLGTFVDGYWEPKVGTAIDELNARKLDEDDMKAARELGVTWHSFENEIEERDYSRSSDLDYWMEKLNTIVPEPDSDSDIPMAPDLPVRDP
ncbi:hypothetical protein GCG54_00006330 [Colletotrichum gloeosporioides]|uniref:Ankyrin repeat protein n=1 Tax=Colletotrichum gloeosporioides TaxID=474922 RepID=A0A8H4CR17_COLGL|nr:uncharacterized protein GCG54_00006330 [Colletotrichum gloeosporioides]KAF3808470.1 hypothetical protein GCG54_00006330 [Colletotrichum gloeosporioides]